MPPGNYLMTSQVTVVDDRMKRKLLQDLGRGPTPHELATQMDISPEKVWELQPYAREPLSLDQTIGEEGDVQRGEFIEDRPRSPSTRSPS